MSFYFLRGLHRQLEGLFITRHESYQEDGVENLEEHMGVSIFASFLQECDSLSPFLQGVKPDWVQENEESLSEFFYAKKSLYSIQNRGEVSQALKTMERATRKITKNMQEEIGKAIKEKLWSDEKVQESLKNYEQTLDLSQEKDLKEFLCIEKGYEELIEKPLESLQTKEEHLYSLVGTFEKGLLAQVVQEKKECVDLILDIRKALDSVFYIDENIPLLGKKLMLNILQDVVCNVKKEADSILAHLGRLAQIGYGRIVGDAIRTIRKTVDNMEDFLEKAVIEQKEGSFDFSKEDDVRDLLRLKRNYRDKIERPFQAAQEWLQIIRKNSENFSCQEKDSFYSYIRSFAESINSVFANTRSVFSPYGQDIPGEARVTMQHLKEKTLRQLKEAHEECMHYMEPVDVITREVATALAWMHTVINDVDAYGHNLINRAYIRSMPECFLKPDVQKELQALDNVGVFSALQYGFEQSQEEMSFLPAAPCLFKESSFQEKMEKIERAFGKKFHAPFPVPDVNDKALIRQGAERCLRSFGERTRSALHKERVCAFATLGFITVENALKGGLKAQCSMGKQEFIKDFLENKVNNTGVFTSFHDPLHMSFNFLDETCRIKFVDECVPVQQLIFDICKAAYEDTHSESYRIISLTLARICE